MLPPEYDRTVTLRQRNLPHDKSLAAVLDGLMVDCKLGTMRSFVHGITGFLDADAAPHGRRAKTLRLEFFQTHGVRVVDRLIAAAVGAWGVQDLEVVVRPASCHGHAPAYSFPHDSLMAIELRAVPMLARLACLTNTVELVLGSVPCLTRTNLTFHVDDDDELAVPPRHDQLGQFLGTMSSPAMASLVVRFTGRRSTWMNPKRLDQPLRGLKRLLVAELPSNWDVSWVRMLLMDTPSLEVLHIHVAHAEEEPERYGVIWSRRSQEWRHPRIKELVMAGFTQRHVESFLRHAVSSCTSLQRLALLKDGHVRYDGLWDWEMIGQQQCAWSHQDEKAVTRMLNSGPRPLVGDDLFYCICLYTALA